MPAFEHRGLITQYDVRGDGPALLFLHGLGADRRQSIETCRTVQGHRLITLDMPGHGDSFLRLSREHSPPPSFAAYAAIAVDLLDHLNVERAIIGGMSMGAGIALHLALSETARCRALLLVRPAWLDGPGTPHLEVLATIGHWLMARDVATAEARLEALPLYQALTQENPLAALSIHGALSRPQAVEGASVLPALVMDQPIPSLEALHALAMPALVLGNHDDPLHPIDIATTLAEALPMTRYQILPPRYRDPSAHQDALHAALDAFVAQLDPPAADAIFPDTH